MLHGESFYDAPTHNYIAFIQEGKIYIAHSLTAVPRQLVVDRQVATGTDVAIAFNTEFIAGPERKTLHRTIGDVQIFHVTNNTLYYRNGITGEPHKLSDNVDYVSASYGWVDILYGIEDQGLVVVFSRGTEIYSMSLKNNLWSTPELLHTMSTRVGSLKVQRTHDYRLAIKVSTSEGTYTLLTKRANIMRATQDTDAIRTSIKTGCTVLSVKQPKILKARCLDNYTIIVDLDAPVEVKPYNGHLPNIQLSNDKFLPVRCAVSCIGLTPNQLRITTDLNIGVLKNNLTLSITQSEYITTPGGTLVQSISALCDTTNVSTDGITNIDLLTLHNIY